MVPGPGSTSFVPPHETEFGEKYMITRGAVEKHILYIKEVTPATSRENRTRSLPANSRKREYRNCRPETFENLAVPRVDFTTQRLSQMYEARQMRAFLG